MVRLEGPGYQCLTDIGGDGAGEREWRNLERHSASAWRATNERSADENEWVGAIPRRDTLLCLDLFGNNADVSSTDAKRMRLR